ncbi:MAG TPA: LemA family protein [Vicinamibacteria bacterium]
MSGPGSRSARANAKPAGPAWRAQLLVIAGAGFAFAMPYLIVPNLVETVQGYATHEGDTLTRVTELRAAAMRAGTPGEKARAENVLTETLRSLFALVEAYPALKADGHFQDLMKQMRELEDNIEYARRYYNASVAITTSRRGSSRRASWRRRLRSRRRNSSSLPIRSRSGSRSRCPSRGLELGRARPLADDERAKGTLLSDQP